MFAKPAEHAVVLKLVELFRKFGFCINICTVFDDVVRLLQRNYLARFLC